MDPVTDAAVEALGDKLFDDSEYKEPMSTEKRLAFFVEELDMFQCEMCRDFAKYCLTNAPDYFFTMPASTTSKYHPSWAIKKHGLIAHTKAAIHVANELWPLYKHLNSASFKLDNLIIMALMFHDVMKKGYTEQEHSVTHHPDAAATWIQEQAIRYIEETSGDNGEIFAIAATVATLIKTHMGQWGRAEFAEGNHFGNMQKYVHFCDYVAAQKFMSNPYPGVVKELD